MFEKFASPRRSGFRKHCSCQNVLTSIVEKAKKSLDNKQVYGALLTDLSKAFDCLPYRLLISKLHAYGLSILFCKLIASYFTERQQRVSIGNCKSAWLTVKGAPQGSVIGPFLFNVFVKDLVKYLEDQCDVYNYADDNTAGTSVDTIDSLCRSLQRTAGVMLSWFDLNYMKANPEKFQFIFVW